MRILNVGLMVDGRDVGLARELKKLSSFYHEISTGDQGVNQKIKDSLNHNFDFAFFQIQARDIIHKETWTAIHQKGVFTMNWMGDVRTILERWFFEADPSLTLFSNERDIKAMTDRGYKADFLQIGIDEEIFKKRNVPKNKSVVFMGNHYGSQFPLGPERMDLVRWLTRRRFDVYGSYPGSISNLTGNQIEESKVYNNTKIAINHSHFFIGRYTSDRLFRILGSGAFCLSHHYPGIEKDFIIGKDLETYKSWDELSQKINYYLSHDKEREEIANNGYMKCHEEFTYTQMAENIINLYKKYK